MSKLALAAALTLCAASARAEGSAAAQLEKQLAIPGRKVAAYEVKPAKDPGKLTGKVTLAGPAPEVPPLKRTKDPGTCGANGADESLVLGAAGEVANAVVTVEAPSGKKLELPKEASLDQKGCTYVPHVQALPVGTPLALLNSDPVLHNAHGYREDTTVFNQAQPLQDRPGFPHKTITLKNPGLLKVKCDVHGWMTAFIYVSENPYFAVTGKDGTFSIDGLPPGTYTVKVWHERLAPTEQQVTIPAGGAAKADFKLAQK
ncbi:MAG: carboxypeptidase regulatory-like domain-containing protein [Deltaproteobacteria bacterium]|nr:carboxypeptidase regulatory-like domain-containing protein [Deltaproteobacteria bacterium]